MTKEKNQTTPEPRSPRNEGDTSDPKKAGGPTGEEFMYTKTSKKGPTGGVFMYSRTIAIEHDETAPPETDVAESVATTEGD